MIYFGKTPNQLNLIEAIRLSVIPQNPNRRRLDANQAEPLLKASSKLFQRWIEQHPTDTIHQGLIELPWVPVKRNLPFFAPHFVERIQKSCETPITLTTLNLKLQKLIENITHQYLERQKE